MKNKKETGGLTTDDLIQPGEEQTLDANNLIDTIENNQSNTSRLEGNLLNSLTSLQYENQSYLSPFDMNIKKGEYDEYDRLIDGPFSLMNSSVDDIRAEGQGFGEKAWNSYGVKLIPKIGSHVVGSTIGLLDGFAEVGMDMYKNGVASSNWNKFFNNDFQRSLDDFDKSMDEKFPVYYTSENKN